MKRFIITLAVVASAVSSFAGGCGGCGSCQAPAPCAAACKSRPCNGCAKHYYPGQTFCTGALNLGLGCNSRPACNPCR